MDITLLRKEIQFRGSRRGMKELDLIMARYMDAYLNVLNEADLIILRDLMIETDQDIFGWLNGERPVPAHIDSDVFRTLQNMLESRKC